MFGHPSLVASHSGGDTEGEAFFAQQGIPAVTGAEAHDETLFGEVGDVGVLRVAGPGDILFTSRKRLADRVEAFDESAGLGDLCVDFHAHTGHHTHVGHHIRAIGDFNAVLGDGRSDRSHTKGDDIHGASFHATGE